MAMDGARLQLETFFEKYSADIASEGRALLERLEARLPGATVMVYDNYNALAIGFAAEDRVSAVVLSIALYPRWIDLFFMRGAQLRDAHGLLKGSGSKVRHIPKVTSASLDDERIEALIVEALAIAQPPINRSAPRKFLIKSVSAKQRPRRPSS